MLLAAAAAHAQASVLKGLVTTHDDGLALPGRHRRDPRAEADGGHRRRRPLPLELPADAVGKTLEVRVSLLGLRTQTKTVLVRAEGLSEDFALGLSFQEEITVGSRAPGAEAEKAVPVDVLTVRQIQTTGASETNAILQALAPSFNFPRPTLSDGADTVRPATLRGLGPDQVLVLINGKRRHQSAHVATSAA